LDSAYNTMRGCSIRADSFSPADDSLNDYYYDCIFDVDDLWFKARYYNCVTSNSGFGSGSVLSNCQTSWADSLSGMSVTDSQASWYIGHFDKNINTPPLPGHGSPGYTGYDDGPWGHTRDSIGAFSFETAPTSSPSVSPSLSPSVSESVSPSISPSISPSTSPSISESLSPSVSESESPSVSPSISPSASPSINPAHPAESCIRTLLKFDDMLVMVTSVDLGNGLMGYRAGQKIETKDDFIEFL
jgi:hypothetical protein